MYSHRVHHQPYLLGMFSHRLHQLHLLLDMEQKQMQKFLTLSRGGPELTITGGVQNRFDQKTIHVQKPLGLKVLDPKKILGKKS